MENAGTIKSAATVTASEESMPRWRKHFTWGSLIVTLIAAAAVLPPLINVGRYQRQVTSLVSRSLGRPVQLSSVELRLLPRPGFILNNLSVAEDPEFGSEPVLKARTVVASVGILSLWKGKLAIDRVSVDDASLNLVQSSQGRWNLESLMMGAQPTLTQNSAGGSSSTPGKSAGFPYLEATDSRVQLKHGADKSAYSIMNTELSLWQPDSGQWRVRLRGQPVRTDIEMSWADTGEVRMEASLRAAPQLRDMPLKLQMEWRDAHLGQLSRLILGSDAGWRGEVTADIDVQGTAESAHTKARFQATGVRREEFAPETPLDLDANCSFEYRHSHNAIHALTCDSALGSGKLHLKAELPGTPPGKPTTKDATPRTADSATAMLEVQQVPLQAALDLMHTVRVGFAPGISAKGVANGSLTYQTASILPGTAAKAPRSAKSKPQSQKSLTAAPPSVGNLQGAITVTGAALKGGELKEAIVLPTMTWTPVSDPPNSPSGLGTRFTLNFPASTVSPLVTPKSASTPSKPVELSSPSAKPSGGAAASGAEPQSRGGDVSSSHATSSEPAPSPERGISPANSTNTPGSNDARDSNAAPAPAAAQALTIRLAVAQSGFQVAINGTVATPRLRSLAYALGLPHSDSLDSFLGGSSDLDLAVSGRWIENYEESDSSAAPSNSLPGVDSGSTQADGPKRYPAIPIAKTAAASNSSVSDAAFNLTYLPSVKGAGTLQIHHAQWKPAYLAQPAELLQTVATVSGTRLSFTSDFAYGSGPAIIRGTATVQTSPVCEGINCEPQIQIHFGALDSATLQAALTGTPRQKSLLEPLMNRIRPSEKPVWPPMTINVDADSLALGQTTLRKPLATVRVDKNGDLQFENWQAGLLGGEASGNGSYQWGADKPEFEFEGSFTKINPAAAGALAAAHWSGSGNDSGINGKGIIKFDGLDWKQLSSSASGEIQFTWPQGSVATANSQQIRFENWTGTLVVHNGKAELGPNTLISGRRSSSLAGAIPLGGSAKFTVSSTSPQIANVVPAATRSGPGALPIKPATR